MKCLDFLTPTFLIYIIKCILGLSICYLFYWLFPDYNLYSSMVSVLLVISPDDLECRALPLSRIRANLVGCLVGGILFLIHPPNLLIMGTGVVITILVCGFFHLGASTRTALAALIIVLVQEINDHSWIGALQRMIGVFLGCIVALLITYITQQFIKLRKQSK